MTADNPTSVKILSEAATAKKLGVNARTLANWRWRKYGPPFLKIGRRVEYIAGDVEAWHLSQYGGWQPAYPARYVDGERLSGYPARCAARNVEIAALIAAGDLTYREIGEHYGISPARVGQIGQRQGVKKRPRP